MVFCVNKRHMTSENSVPYAACSVLIDIYGLVLGDVQLSLQLCDHLCVLLIGQMNRIRIGDLKTTAELKATFVFRNDMEMQVRQLVAVSTQIDLGAAPQLLYCSSNRWTELHQTGIKIGHLLEMISKQEYISINVIQEIHMMISMIPGSKAFDSNIISMKFMNKGVF